MLYLNLSYTLMFWAKVHGQGTLFSMINEINETSYILHVKGGVISINENATEIEMREWGHVALTKSKEEFSLYINGHFRTSTQSTLYCDKYSSYYIGVDRLYGTKYFNGFVYQLMINNRETLTTFSDRIESCLNCDNCPVKTCL